MSASPAPTAAAPPRHRRVLRPLGLTLAAVLAGLTLLLAIGTLFSPGRSTAALIATMAWALIGPLLVILALAASALAILASARRRTRPAIVILVLALAALVWSEAIVTSMVSAAMRAGGSVNPFAAIIPTSPSGEPDATETYTTTDGEAQQALIFQPPQPAERRAGHDASR